MKEEQQRSFPNILEVKPEKEDVDNKEAITSRNGGELKELKRGEVDANELKELVAKDKKEESTSPEPNEMRKEVVDTFPEMTLWGEMHKELKKKKKRK